MRLTRFSILFVALALALLLPRPALAHDGNAGKIDITLTGRVSGVNEVMLTAAATPGIAAPTLEMIWVLLDGGELRDGPTETTWENPPAREAVSQARRVHLPGAGVYPVGVSAILVIGESMRFVDGDILFLIVDEKGRVTVSKQDPNAFNPMGTVMIEQTALVDQGIQPAEATSANGDPCFTVRGVFNRIDRMPTSGGYAPDTLVPVRWTEIEMREEDTFFDDSYGEAITDAQGRFSFSFCDDDGIFDDELELYVRMTAAIRSPQGIDIVEVQEDGFIPPEDVYEFVTPTFSSEGGTYDKSYQLTLEQSGIMNMADAVLDAWNFWNSNGGAVGDDAIFDALAEINWEAGDDLSGSYYNGYVWDHINIADGPADPDEWDDSVIIHEWNHQADDNYGCDDTPGGAHSSRQNLGDLELAWSEGYANYYQSAVRNALGRSSGNWYLDGNAMGQMSGWNLETLVGANGVPYAASLYTPFNEAAISAMLWDLEDTAIDGQDRTGFGPLPLQQVFTDPVFSENGDIFDDTCTAWVYLTSWAQTGKTANRDVGAIIQQNIGLVISQFQAATVAVSQAITGANQGVEAGPGDIAPDDAKWWKNLSWVVDNSASMAAAGKLDAVKTVIKEQVNDLASTPKGTEFNLYTFNNSGGALQQPVGQKFYEDLVSPAIDALTTADAPDSDCAVAALGAMTEAAQRQKGGDIWLYTDRSSTLYPSIENAKRLLNQRQIHGSFAMLGGCAGVLPAKMSDVTGGEISYLGGAANGSQSTGIVPYLLTALGSGGQFIYVREDQLGSAADILRAQVANSAGAGKWSDYVSDTFTYRWDRLEAGEYQWIDLLPPLSGEDRGQFPRGGELSYDLPTPFSFYGRTVTKVMVSLDGYVELNPCIGSLCTLERLYLENLRGGPRWSGDFPPAFAAYREDAIGAGGPAAVSAPCSGFLPASGWFVKVYSTQYANDWHVISTHGCAAAPNTSFLRKYQIWLNTRTGEIRYLYNNLLGNDAASARIGVLATASSPILPDRAVVVSDNDVAGASGGMGYKFTPAPPQPTRTYTVPVDAFMEGVGFLQTGYSGRFEPMIVRDPAGNPVDCDDTANVLCLTMNNVGTDRMVQYVQVNAGANTGEWTATIDAQAGAEGTFTFSALAASSIAASTLGERQLPSAGSVRISTRLGGVADGGILDAWFQHPNGERFGSEFSLFDDGAHDDGRAGDGIFSNPSVVAPGVGVAYLWVQGSSGGESFVRSDPTPYNFQPFSVTVVNKEIAFTGDPVVTPVHITNHDSVQQCTVGYAAQVMLPEGWTASWTIPPGDDGSEQLFGVCIGPGATIERELQVTPSQSFFDGPSLASGEVSVSFIERERGAISDSDTAAITRYRQADRVVLLNPLGEAALRPNGTDTATLTLMAYDETDLPVSDGTLVTLSTTRGTIAVDGVSGLGITAPTQGGRVTITFTAETRVGDAVVTAELPNGMSDSTIVRVRRAGAVALDLVASPIDLSGGVTSSQLVATMRDVWGAPVAGVEVRMGVSDDSGAQGTVSGGDVTTGITDANGEFHATFIKSEGASGVVAVRVEAMVNDEVFAEDSATLHLGVLGATQRVFLPLQVRQ